MFGGLATWQGSLLKAYRPNTQCLVKRTIIPSSRASSVDMTHRMHLSTSAASARQSTISDETWILGSGHEEEERRATAVAEALGLPCTLKRIYPRQSINWLPKIVFRWLSLYNAKRITTKNATSHRQLPWYLTSPDGKDALNTLSLPRYAIACGLDSVPVCFELAAISQKKTMTVFIGYPKAPFGYFGAVVMLRHQLRRLGRMSMMVMSQKNIILAETVPHRVTPLTLSIATKQLSNLLPSELIKENNKSSSKHSEPRQPLIAVVLGGINPEFRWTSQDANQLASQVATLTSLVKDAQVLIVTNKSTPSFAIKAFDSINDKHCYHINTAQSNDAGYRQLMAILANATHLCVTAGSTQLTSEAVATGKPVYVIGYERCTGALAIFQNKLKEMHVTRRFRPLRSNRRLPIGNDPLSYVGQHAPFPTQPIHQNGASSIAKQIQQLNKKSII
ncbi:mitochondrial fission ELM1-domain-containing protein [Syncephalis fuscata]|nr:mitochondrial fission ELM1-domain-containing protein [Syncephalis fuscata]